MRRYQYILSQSDLDALRKLRRSSATVSVARQGPFIGSVHFDTASQLPITISVDGKDHEARFETFRLRTVEQDVLDRPEYLCDLSTILFVDILMSEESTRPATQNEMEGRLGSEPGSVQIRHRPGDTPDGATASSIVATGILLTDATAKKLALIADMFPYAMQVFLDEQTNDLSSEFEIIPLDEYARRFHPV